MKTKMADVKLVKVLTENVLAMEFYPRPLAGEKLVKTDETCIEQIEIDLALMPENVKHLAMLHGFSQKFGDNLALTKDIKETFTVEEASEKTKDLERQLMAGDWNATGRSKAEIIKIDKAGVNSKLDAMTEDEKAAAVALMKSLGIKF